MAEQPQWNKNKQLGFSICGPESECSKLYILQLKTKFKKKMYLQTKIFIKEDYWEFNIKKES